MELDKETMRAAFTKNAEEFDALLHRLLIKNDALMQRVQSLEHYLKATDSGREEIIVLLKQQYEERKS